LKKTSSYTVPIVSGIFYDLSIGAIFNDLGVRTTPNPRFKVMPIGLFDAEYVGKVTR